MKKTFCDACNTEIKIGFQRRLMLHTDVGPNQKSDLNADLELHQSCLDKYLKAIRSVHEESLKGSIK